MPKHEPIGEGEGKWKAVSWTIEPDRYSVTVLSMCACGDPKCYWTGTLYTDFILNVHD